MVYNSRRALRLRYGRAPATPIAFFQKGGKSTSRSSKHSKQTRTRRRQALHQQGSSFHPNANLSMGFEWNQESCWMDSSLMALFFPDEMYKVVFPMFARNRDEQLSEVRETLMTIVHEMRASNQTAPQLHGLRTLLANHFLKTRDQKYAFQRENELGYVFYFLQEFLKLFKVDCVRIRNPSSKRVRKQYVMEVFGCSGEPFSQCLRRNYRRSRFDSNYLRFMVIEMIGKTVKPEEYIEFKGVKWSLCSMIVFDCSHFISYLKQGGKWYLYDDNRSLSHKTLQPYSFGEYYQRGICQFRYGVENTFFFYVRS
jgi:hypothetical protein